MNVHCVGMESLVGAGCEEEMVLYQRLVRTGLVPGYALVLYP